MPCRDYPKRSEYFIKGTEPVGDCLVEKNLDGREYYVFVEFDPVSTDGKNRWQEGVNAWTAAQADSKYHVPGELLNEPNRNPDEIKVNIKKPSGHSQIEYNFETEAEIQSGKKITKVEFHIDGSVKDSKSGDNRNVKFNFTFASANKGKHKIKVKAFNEAGKSGEAEVEVSAGEPWKD